MDAKWPHSISVIFLLLSLLMSSNTAPTKTAHRESVRYVISTGDLGFFDDDNIDYKEDLVQAVDNTKMKLSWWDNNTPDKPLRNAYGEDYESLDEEKQLIEAANALDWNHDIKREITTEKQLENASTDKEASIKETSSMEIALADEYQSQIDKNNDTFHLESAATEVSIKESLGNVIKIKNCSEESRFDLGFKAYACFDKHDAKGNTKILLKLLVTWIIVSSVLAIFLWCRSGLCSCCCACQICQVKKRTELIKEFLAENPPGQWKEGDNIYNYEPSEVEIYIYEKMLHKLLTL